MPIRNQLIAYIIPQTILQIPLQIFQKPFQKTAATRQNRGLLHHYPPNFNGLQRIAARPIFAYFWQEFTVWRRKNPVGDAVMG